MKHPEGHSPEGEQEMTRRSSGNGLRPAAEREDASSVGIYDDELLRPIPIEMPSVAGWKEVKVREGGEPMVPLGPFSYNHDLFTSSVYYGEHSNSPYMSPDNRLEGALVTLFVRDEVAPMLRHAQQLLPEGHHLIVLDSYRTLEVQQALYDHYLNALRRQHPDWGETELSAETQKYVSIPSSVESRPSPHNTGGSVDLAIFTLPPEIDSRVKQIELRLDELKLQAPQEFAPLDEARNPVLRELYKLEMEKIGLIRRHADFLNFGTQFDHGGGEAASNYFERLEQQRPLSGEETEARDNRRMLYNAMVQAGMQPYEDEWWHFNSPKSQMGAKVAGADHAEYGGMELTEDNLAHEQMRQAHRSGLIRIQEGVLQGLHFRLMGKIGHPMGDEAFTELIELNEDVLNETGDPRLTYLPRAAIIEPPDTQAA
jgi:zinc D-Ala-D-Ala dipeptidase